MLEQPSFRVFVEGDEVAPCPKCGWQWDGAESGVGRYWNIWHQDGRLYEGDSCPKPDYIAVQCPRCNYTRDYRPLDSQDDNRVYDGWSPSKEGPSGTLHLEGTTGCPDDEGCGQ